MARPLWSGNISFGLVTIPVDLYPATQDRDIHFHLVTPDGKCRLRQKLYCPDTGKEYDFSSTARGYEIAPDEYVIVDPKELKKIQPDSGHAMEIEKFVPLAEIDPVYFNRPYILAPGKRGEKPYALLREALYKSKRAAIAHFLMRQHQYLAVVRPREDVLMLNTMNYEDEIRNVEDLDVPAKNTKLPAKEVELALQLIDSLSGNFDPGDYKDAQRQEMLKSLKQLAKGHTVRAPGEGEKKKKTEKVVSLMDRLKQSLKENKKGSGKGRSRETGKSGSASRKKAA